MTLAQLIQAHKEACKGSTFHPNVGCTCLHCETIGVLMAQELELKDRQRKEVEGVTEMRKTLGQIAQLTQSYYGA